MDASNSQIGQKIPRSMTPSNIGASDISYIRNRDESKIVVPIRSMLMNDSRNSRKASEMG